MNKYYLELLPEFKAFCISDEVIDECKTVIPEMYIPDDFFMPMAIGCPEIDLHTSNY